MVSDGIRPLGVRGRVLELVSTRDPAGITPNEVALHFYPGTKQLHKKEATMLCHLRWLATRGYVIQKNGDGEHSSARFSLAPLGRKLSLGVNDTFPRLATYEKD